MYSADQNSLLSIKNLNVQYKSKKDSFHAVKSLSLKIDKGEIVAFVGETGSGKTSVGRALMQLNGKNANTTYDHFVFEDHEISPEKLKNLRGREIGMIFQEPTVYLDPSMSCGNQLLEVLREDNVFVGDAKEEILKGLLGLGFDEPGRIYRSYPNQLSGGQCQRIMLLMATLRKPKLLIADEPTSSVDINSRNKIFEHLKSINSTLNTSVLLITHDLQMAKTHADRIYVMKEGELVETIDLSKPDHNVENDYTAKLFQSTLGSELRLRNIDTERKPPILAIENLNITYSTSGGRSIFFNKKKEAVIDVSLEVNEGECLGILGESGSGKTSFAWCIANLIEKSAGTITKNLNRKSGIQLVFQNPALALSPKQTVGKAVEEVVKANNRNLSKTSVAERVNTLFDQVKLDLSLKDRLPQQLSGGERQRICIGKALAANPYLIIFDEAVSSLDSSVRKDILKLLLELQTELNLTYIFISHDFSVIKFVADRAIVMNEGRIIEEGNIDDLIKQQENPITTKLVLQS